MPLSFGKRTGASDSLEPYNHLEEVKDMMSADSVYFTVYHPEWVLDREKLERKYSITRY